MGNVNTNTNAKETIYSHYTAQITASLNITPPTNVDGAQQILITATVRTPSPSSVICVICSPTRQGNTLPEKVLERKTNSPNVPKFYILRGFE